jgi:hypothetical protein
MRQGGSGAAFRKSWRASGNRVRCMTRLLSMSFSKGKIDKRATISTISWQKNSGSGKTETKTIIRPRGLRE